MQLTIAHSPDADDAFMFYALSERLIETGEYELSYVLSDIQSLSEAAKKGLYDLTAISFHAYAYLADQYDLLSCGSSMGVNYGPVLITNESKSNLLQEIKAGEAEVLVPGELTSSYLALKLFAPRVKTRVVNFSEIQEQVRENKARAGLIIHEGQVTYQEENLFKLIDLGEWWFQETNFPIPLGVNAIRKSLPEKVKKDLNQLLRKSILYSLENLSEALNYSIKFGRTLQSAQISQAEKFVKMYVNDLTLSLTPSAEESIKLFLEKGAEKKLLPALKEKVSFIYSD